MENNYITLESEPVPAMLSLDDKNYILCEADGKLKIHGSSLKGKHMPIVCDDFRDALCHAVFDGDDPLTVFEKFQSLSRYTLRDFQIRIYPTKLGYHKNTLYFKLLRQLATSGIHAVAGASLEYVKAADGYRVVMLFNSEQDRIDYMYYKRRLAVVASRILFQPAKQLLPLLRSGQTPLKRWQNKQ